MHDIHRNIPTWSQSEKSIAAYIHHIRNKSIQDPGLPPFLTIHHPPTLEASTRSTKNACSSKNSHSFILSHRNLFITLACGIWVFYIVTNSNQSWHNSHSTIPLYMRPSPINSITPPLTTTCITMAYDMHGCNYSLALTHPTVTKNGLKII